MQEYNAYLMIATRSNCESAAVHGVHANDAHEASR